MRWRILTAPSSRRARCDARQCVTTPVSAATDEAQSQSVSDRTIDREAARDAPSSTTAPATESLPVIIDPLSRIGDEVAGETPDEIALNVLRVVQLSLRLRATLVHTPPDLGATVTSRDRSVPLSGSSSYNAQRS